MAGGEKEVEILASQIALKAREAGDDVTVSEHTITRQCDREFFDEAVTRKVQEADAVISMGCGVGVQYCAEMFPDKPVYPGLNTKFFGANGARRVGRTLRRLRRVRIGLIAAICPMVRCSKSLMNGPCGGSYDGLCEVTGPNKEEIQCAWQLIYGPSQGPGSRGADVRRQPPKDWSTSSSGGPRKMVREEAKPV